MAGVFALAWLLRLSVLVRFISESILTGFKAGAAHKLKHAPARFYRQ